MAMTTLGRSNDLAEEIRLCGKLRNDIGRVLKYSAQKAAKVQNEQDEDKALACLIDKELSHLETTLASAEGSFQDASGSLEKLELAIAHMKATNSVLGDQLVDSLQQIDSSNEAFEGLRKRHVAFCKMQDETHKKMASIESLLRNILSEDAEMRSCRAEIDGIKTCIFGMDEKKAAMLPMLERCKSALGAASAEYDKSRNDNARHLSVIENCRATEEELRNKLKALDNEQKELRAQEAELESKIARQRAETNAALQRLTRNQEEALEDQAKLIRELEQKEEEKRMLDEDHEKLKRETAEVTEEMHQTIRKMGELRQRDAELAANKAALMQQLKAEEEAIVELKKEEHVIRDLQRAQQKATALAEEKTTGEAKLNELARMKETALIEQNEMNALLEQENEVLSERLRLLEAVEKESDETIGQRKELEGLIVGLETFYNEQRDVTQKLMISRKQVDLQLEKVNKIELRLRELLSEKAKAFEKSKLERDKKEQEEALLSQLEEDTSLLREELAGVKQKKQEFERKVAELEQTEKHIDDKEPETGGGAELARLSDELKKKYEEACAQMRANFRRQYTSMLEQTLKEEEKRLAAEKQTREMEINKQIEHLKSVQRENQAKLLTLQQPEHLRLL